MFVSLKIFLAALLSVFRKTTRSATPSGSIHDFEMRTLSGETIQLAKFKGTKLLIVNTASNCGYTNQYEDLEKLHKRYYPKLVVLGFPSNDFFGQEPGSNQQIADFCSRNYGVSFPVSEKVSVKGRDMHPLFRLLKQQTGHAPLWNFCKYLVDEQGNAVAYYHTKVKPFDSRITDKI